MNENTVNPPKGGASVRENIITRGHLKITTTTAEAGPKVVVDKKNMIMINSKEILSMALGEGSVDSLIKTVALGTGGDLQPLEMTMEALNTPVYTDDFNDPPTSGVSYEYVLNGDLKVVGVKFIIAVDYAEGNPVAGSYLMNEIGLLSAGVTPRLFSMQVFDAVAKNDTIRFDIEWTISF